MSEPFPAWTGTRAVKLVRQTEVAECGLASLAMVAGYHGMSIDLGTLRRRFAPSLRGATLKTLITTADQMGFSARAVRAPLDEIGSLDLPAILHWDMSHFVVLEKVRGSRVLVHDPAGRSTWFSMPELSKRFTGVALELVPGADFEPAKVGNPLRLRELWRSMTGLKRAVLQTLVLSVVLQAFVLATPYYMQLTIDEVLPSLDYDLLTTLALGFGMFTLVNAIATYLRSSVLLSAGTSLSFGVGANVARRLFRLPIAWFERRHVGDVLSRFQAIQPIQAALTTGAVSALVDGALAIVTVAVMFAYSAKLAFLSLAAFVAYASVVLVSYRFQRAAQDEAIVSRSKEQTSLIESLRGIVTLRLYNREGLRHATWQARLADALNAEVRLGRVTIWQQTSHALIQGLESIIVLMVAARMVMAGELSLGMLFAFMAYKVQFIDKATLLLTHATTFRMLELHLERLADIAKSEQDPSFLEANGSNRDFSGLLELKNLDFRYHPAEPLVLKDLQLSVHPGEYVAITGPSGGGKSTLVKLILGLLEPDGGDILVDGTPLAQFGRKRFGEQVAAVLQDDHLFAGSLADNIALFDDAPDPAGIHEAARMAEIHDDIMSMPMGYETLVGDMGSSLSGGQRQRLLLARALYRKPRMLVMDEGTSALDLARERAINDRISALRITRILVAHRPDSIASADRVYDLFGGRLFEREGHQRRNPDPALVGLPARA